MAKKKYRYVIYNEDSDEIMRNTTDAEDIIDCLSKLLGDDITFHKIEVDGAGKLVESLDNLELNREIIKRLKKESEK